MTTPAAFESYRGAGRRGTRRRSRASPACTRPPAGSSSAHCSPVRTGTSHRTLVPAEATRSSPRSSTSPRWRLDEREAHDLQGLRFAGHERLRPPAQRRPGAPALAAGPRRRRLPTRRRANPRRHHRVRTLSLPSRRRPHPPPRRATLLQAPRPRARGRREDPRRRARLRLASLRRLQRRERRRLRIPACSTPSGWCRPQSSVAPARSCSSSSGPGAT